MLRWHAGFALGRMGKAPVPALRSLLESSDSLVVSAAVDALEWIGENAGDAVEDLQALIRGDFVTFAATGLYFRPGEDLRRSRGGPAGDTGDASG